jgi:hypothetical protein
MPPMVGRLLAICGWLAHVVGRRVRGPSLGRFGSAPVLGLAALLAVGALLPLLIPSFDPQPEDVVVQTIFDGRVNAPDGWIRLRGRIVPLTESPTGEPGAWSLLVDEENLLRSIVLRTAQPLEAAASTMVTGRLVDATVVVDEELPIEATVAGTPPRVVPDAIVVLDATTKPVRSVLWPISILPALLAAGLVIGSRVGYPIFRPTSEVDVLTTPLGPGERVPAAFGGRVGPTGRNLADPGAALLLVRRGPKGNLLTAQVLADEGQVAPAPVTIGGGWTSGRIGDVYALTETVPALTIRSELVDATFLFARRTERDRVAALVSVER